MILVEIIAGIDNRNSIYDILDMSWSKSLICSICEDLLYDELRVTSKPNSWKAAPFVKLFNLNLTTAERLLSQQSSSHMTL